MLAVVLVAAAMSAVSAVPAADIEFIEDDTSGEFNLSGEAFEAEPGALDARIIFNHQQESGDHYVAALTGGKAKFYRVVDGQTAFIGTGGDLTSADGDTETVQFTLQRRDWVMTLVWDNEVVARAFDSTLHDGRAGTLVKTGELRDLFVQPVGEVFAEDDFVRAEGETSDWDAVSGKWEQRSLRDDEQAEREDATKAANAFSYLGAATQDGPALSTIGYWFWDAYNMQAAVKSIDDGAVGLVLYFRDVENYIAVRYSGRDHADGGRLQVLTVRDAERSVVAEERGGFIPDQWYQIRAAITLGFIKVWVDGELRLVARTDALGQGAVGLYAESSAGAFFDDVVCGPWELFVEDFTVHSVGKWIAPGGAFEQADGRFVVTSDKPSIAVTGRTAWSRYDYAITVKPANGGGCGLIVGYRDPGNYCLVRWATDGPPYAGNAQIVQVVDGAEQVLAEAPVTVPIRTWYRARARLVDGMVSLDLEGRRQVDALLPDLQEGAIGVFAQNAAGAEFSNAVVEVIPPRKPARLTQEFSDMTQHPEMSEWASTAAPWVKPESGSTLWWTKGDYFGDHALVFTIPNVTAQTGVVELLVGAEGPDAETGQKLSITTTAGSRTVGLSLATAEDVVAECETELSADEAVVSLERRAHWLVVVVNDAVVLETDLRESTRSAEQPERTVTQQPD